MLLSFLGIQYWFWWLEHGKTAQQMDIIGHPILCRFWDVWMTLPMLNHAKPRSNGHQRTRLSSRCFDQLCFNIKPLVKYRTSHGQDVFRQIGRFCTQVLWVCFIGAWFMMVHGLISTSHIFNSSAEYGVLVSSLKAVSLRQSRPLTSFHQKHRFHAELSKKHQLHGLQDGHTSSILWRWAVTELNWTVFRCENTNISRRGNKVVSCKTLKSRKAIFWCDHYRTSFRSFRLAQIGLFSSFHHISPPGILEWLPQCIGVAHCNGQPVPWRLNMSPIDYTCILHVWNWMIIIPKL